MGVVEIADNTTNRFDFDTGDTYGHVDSIEAFVSKNETTSTNQTVSLSAELGMKIGGIYRMLITLNPQNYLPDQTVELPIGEYRIRLKPYIKTQ